MKLIKQIPPQTLLQQIFEYKDGNLYWKRNQAKAKQGNVAGWKEKNGYMACGLDGVRYRLHRLIFMYHNNWCPEFIDHINGIKTDNRIENLRPATGQQNIANKPAHKHNKLGLKGVCMERGKYKATIKVNNKSMHIGYFDDAQKAHEAYLIKAKQFHGEFAWTKNNMNT